MKTKSINFLGILLIFIFGTSCSRLEFKQAMKHAPYDAIIVPGVPYHGKKWSDIMKMRVYWSYLLYEKGVTEHIIYSGSAVYTEYYEAVIMKLYAIKLGIPEDKIFTDTIAEHSTENLWYSYKLAKREGFNKIALATDPFQNLMVKQFKNYHDLSVRHLPMNFAEVDSFMRLPSPKIEPTSAIDSNFKSILERESKLKQFMGTLGLNIK